MTDLPNKAYADRDCERLNTDATALDDDALTIMLPAFPGWAVTRDNDMPTLTRTYSFRNFASAMRYAVKLGAVAEAQDHHPRLVVEWGKVTVQWWSHVLAGLHTNDFIMAAKSDAVFDALTRPPATDDVQEASEESFPGSDAPGWR